MVDEGDIMLIQGDAKTISAAWVKARSQMSATVKEDATGNFGKYSTLAAIVKTISEALASNGLAIVQEPSMDEMGLVIETWLVHESGTLMQFTPLTLPLTDRRPQAVGSALTYGRRYALASICGLAPDDDDGQAAQNAQDAPQRAQAQGAANPPTSKPKTPQRAPVPSSGDDGDVDTVKTLPRLSEAQHKNLHALGRTFYGNEWDEQRPKLVQAISKGAISSSNDLTPEEADRLIAGITKKINEVEKAKMKVAQAA